VEVLYQALPKLADTFFLQRLLAADRASDEVAKEVLSLQERIRLNTQGVRNWSYFSNVVRISKELHAPLDAPFIEKVGFGITDLVEVMAQVVKEYERRANEHLNTLGKMLRGKNARELFRLYFKYVPELVGSADEMIAALPPGIGRDGAISLIMQHFDLRLAERATLTPDEISTLSRRPKEMVEKILRSVSRPPGDLATAKPEHLFLSNPVWTAPGIDMGQSFIFAMPQAVFSHIHSIVRRLAEENGLEEALEGVRARYLEQQLEGTLRRALPTASIKAGVVWELDGEQGETDFLGVVDRTVVIAEAKSHRLTPEGLRGAPDRMKRHVQDLILRPSQQSARLQALIQKAKEGDDAARRLMAQLGIDASIIDRVIRLSVTLDDLSVLSSVEGDFKKVGWVPDSHELAPTMHIADLMCITDILESPLLILHYLSERSHFQRAFKLFGDELDFLGLYLSTGFNMAALEGQKDLFALSGASAPIDRYYNGRDGGVSVRKPKVKLGPLYQAIIDSLSDRQPEGWTTAGIDLLASASEAEQRKIEPALRQLRRSVRREHRTPSHINTLHVCPPHERKAAVLFHVFPETKRAEVKANMQQTAEQLLDQGKYRRCVVFARCIENWDASYDACMLVGY
jgi:hypothetical protein